MDREEVYLLLLNIIKDIIKQPIENVNSSKLTDQNLQQLGLHLDTLHSLLKEKGISSIHDSSQQIKRNL